MPDMAAHIITALLSSEPKFSQLGEAIVSSIPRPPAYRVIVVQGILTILVALAAWLHSDVAAKSALLGGLICLLPNAYFTWRAFRFHGARSMTQIVNSFYQGAFWKFLLTALCFTLVFQQVESLNVLALFVAFMTVQLGHLASANLKNL